MLLSELNIGLDATPHVRLSDLYLHSNITRVLVQAWWWWWPCVQLPGAGFANRVLQQQLESRQPTALGSRLSGQPPERDPAG